MVDIGNNLKIQMNIKKLSPYELGQKAGLSRYQVENILYNRSSKLEVLQKLAEALEIDLEQLTSNAQEFSISNDKGDIDCEIFSEVFNLINIVSKNSSIKIDSRKRLFKIAEKFYFYLKENKGSNNSDNKEEVLKGMLIALQND